MLDGAIEVLVVAAGLGRADAIVEVRGAPLIDERLEEADSCFVGDFVGDYKEDCQYSSRGQPEQSNPRHTLREARGATFGAGVGVPVALVLCRLTAVGGSPLGFFTPADIDCRLAGALGPALALCLLSRGGC